MTREELIAALERAEGPSRGLGARSFNVTAWTHHEAEGFTTFEIEPDAEQFSWDFFNGAVEEATKCARKS